jgi:hypothetical protein
MTTKGEWMGPDMVFSDRFLYTLSNIGMHAKGIVGFDFKSGTLFFREFPKMPMNIDCVPLHYLLV